MTIEKNIDGKTAYLKIIGRLDTVSSPELESVLNELSSLEEIVLDFEKLEYISSAGLRVLLLAHKNFARKSGLTVKNVCDAVMDVFKVTGFDDVLTIK